MNKLVTFTLRQFLTHDVSRKHVLQIRALHKITFQANSMQRVSQNLN
jgi:hypothetical protein